MACTIHPYLNACTCVGPSPPTSPSIWDETQGGTQDLPTSVYPEIDETILAGPVVPYQGEKEKEKERDFVAPVATMTGQDLKVNTCFNMMGAFTPFITTFEAQHDYYPERYALSPEERPVFYAGNHYSDKYALSPVERYGKRKDTRENPRSPAPKTRRETRERRRKERELDSNGISSLTHLPPLLSREIEGSDTQSDEETTETLAEKVDAVKTSRKEAIKRIRDIERVSQEAIKSILASVERDSITRRASLPRKAKQHVNLATDSDSDEYEDKPRKLRRRRAKKPATADTSSDEDSLMAEESQRSSRRWKNQTEDESQPRKKRPRRAPKTVNYAE